MSGLVFIIVCAVFAAIFVTVAVLARRNKAIGARLFLTIFAVAGWASVMGILATSR